MKSLTRNKIERTFWNIIVGILLTLIVVMFFGCLLAIFDFVSFAINLY